ncbi:chemotaxis protein CheC [Sediminitomix flava]|uniref:Chemotaxis protein CheY-P-specific phosphatase CheC n=1 Tax=Sediminitomix flava TaxID=379075 RepID=A0A315Z8P5_SEDFL|nr:hypothetical protein [Sediminitomix flava]PWJ39396.1 chemotaxis protein CheY-P-specific phosphatase CheC [Sediminitomix flava]
MNTFFTENQKLLIGNIQIIALNHIAHSLSKMLGDEVFVKSYSEIAFDKLEDALAHYNQESFYVLGTDIKGKFSGATYLLVNQVNEKKICEKLVPANMLGHQEMRDAMLMELDNIVIASYVTKWANLADADIYGYVPSHEVLNRQAFEIKLKKLISEDDKVYFCKSHLYAFKSGIEFELYFLFDKTFVPIISGFDINNSYVGDEERPKKEMEKKKSFLQRLF